MTTTRTIRSSSATARVLDVFRDLDPVTPKQLCDATGLTRPVVEACLRRLTESGDVFLMEIWTLTPARRAANHHRSTRAGRAAAIIAEQDALTVTGRRAKGVLEMEIMNYMRRRPGVDLGPAEVARAVGAKSGAVYPAMERLLRKGELVKTSSDRPVKYKLV